jgi:glycosyltransferase involved in cell wall biosynthesis
MKVYFDYQIFSWQIYGGISRYFVEVIRCLKKQDNCEPTILAPIYINEYLNQLDTEHHVTGIKFPVFPRTGRIIQALSQLCTRLILLFSKPDIYHETYYLDKQLAPSGVKVVLTVYDMIHERFPEQFLSNDKTSKQKLSATTRADHIICISEHTKKDLMEIFKIPQEKISVVYLGVSFNEYKQLGKSSLVTDKPFLLYVGSRSGYKNFDKFLSAYATSNLSNQFDMVAFGDGDFNKKELLQIGTYNLKDKVHHVSGSDELLSKYYSQAEVFVYPSLYEGFGIPPLEAMHFKCPVACSFTSSIPEVVGDAACLFDPNDEASIVDAINSITANNDFKHDLIAKGENRVKQFTWDKCAYQTLDVYRKLM